MGGFNNVGLIKYNNIPLCTGFIVRSALSRRDITLIMGCFGELESKAFIFELNDKTYDIRLVYHHKESGTALFTPATEIDGLSYSNSKFQMANNNGNTARDKLIIGIQGDKVIIYNYNPEDIYGNGYIITDKYGSIYGLVLDQKYVCWETLKATVKDFLDIFFGEVL